MLIRNFELEFFRTTWDEVKIVHHFFMSLTKLDTKGVRVKVKAELSWPLKEHHNAEALPLLHRIPRSTLFSI